MLWSCKEIPPPIRIGGMVTRQWQEYTVLRHFDVDDIKRKHRNLNKSKRNNSVFLRKFLMMILINSVFLQVKSLNGDDNIILMTNIRLGIENRNNKQ